MGLQVERAPWEAEGDEKRATVRRLFGEIAPRYDFLNSIISLARHRSWRSLAVRIIRLQAGGSALDLCSGTGDFLIPLRRAVGDSGRVVGLDFCRPMLERARQKRVPGALVQGDACLLPIRSNSFDGVTVGWGIRNVTDIDAAHREIVRVLKPGGRFVSVDTAMPRNGTVRAVSRFVCGRMFPLVGAMFGAKRAYTYLPKSTERFASREDLKRSIEHAGLVDVRWKDLMFGNICIHWGRKP